MTIEALQTDLSFKFVEINDNRGSADRTVRSLTIEAQTDRTVIGISGYQ